MRITALIALFTWFLKGDEHLKKIQLSGFTQGTTYHITYYAPDTLVAKSDVEDILNSLDSSLSIYKPYSLITSFNNSDSGVETDAHLYNVVQKSLETYRLTEGLFDVTILPLVEAWGFGSKKQSHVPDSVAIKELKKCVSSKNISFKNHYLFKTRPCVRLDVNGIAQGYSVDVVADFLEKNGISNYIVEIGGEIRVNGKKPGGSKMKIGIEAPGDYESEPSIMQQVVELDKGAITTSGNYRKYYESKGKKITHIINPLTGYAVDNELISVTVFAKDAITADAFDNALMLMGLKRALQFVREEKDLEAYFIYHKLDGSVSDTASAGFYRLIKK